MTSRFRDSVLVTTSLLALCACDNVGRAFDPGKGGGGGNTASTNVVAPAVGGTFFDGRPKVRAAFPTGGGWARTTPVVVAFNEAVNQALTTPAQGDALVFCRVAGTTQRLPVAYNFLFGGTVLLVRPVPEWPAAAQQGVVPTIEIVVAPDLRDIDGVRLASTGDPKVVAEFTPDADTQADPNGRVVATLPEDSARDTPREVPIYAIFDRPATPGSVTSSNFRITDGANAEILGAISTPIADAGVADTRIVRFDPSVRLPADGEVRITFEDTIAFPNGGQLDFLGRRPFSSFRTLAFAAPDAVALGNAQPGFANKVNRSILPAPMLDVSLAPNARAGDEVVVRIYGLDLATEPADDVNFVEAKQTVPADNAATLSVSFQDRLGTLAEPRFADGRATFATQVRRGTRTTGWVLADTMTEPRIDIGLPVVTTVGPPARAGSSLDLLIDQEFVTFYGIASEDVSSATLSMLGMTKANFGAAGGGRFTLTPIGLSRSTVPVDYTLTLVDAAGNESQPIAGTVTQRGFVTGVQAGTLTVEVYDEATLQVIPNATVLVEPGLPQKPAVGRVSLPTGPDGRAIFSGLAAPTQTVTVLADGHHVKTLLATGASFASLGVRPLQDATATLQGAVVFAAAAGVSARVGCNAYDDPFLDVVVPNAQLLIPGVPIRPNRPLVLTGFAGAFDSAGNGAFATSVCSMCGSSGITPTPMLAAVQAGASTTQPLAIQNPATGTTVSTPRYNRDFAAAAGLGAIQGTPSVRVHMSMLGVTGTTLFGTGRPTVAGSSTSFDVTASYSLINAITLTPMSPVLWVALEARDAGGNLSQHRSIVTDINTGTTLGTWATPGIPTVTPPGGAVVGSPSVTYADRLDPAIIPGGIAATEIVATDPAGKTWTVVAEDRNGAVGATAVQFPDLGGSGPVGLAPGIWKVRALERLAFSVTAVPGDFFFEELRRAPVTVARSAEVDFTVQ